MPNDVVWTDVVWKEINDAVAKAAAQIRIAQKVFPTIPCDNDPTEVSNDVIKFPDLSIEEGSTKPFVEIYREFELSSAQVSKAGETKLALRLAQMAAKEIALAEDIVLFQGDTGDLPPNVKAEQRGSAAPGLVGFPATATGAGEIPVNKLDPPRTGVVYAENTSAAVVAGQALLTAKGQAPPYALILPTAIYADASVPFPASLATTAAGIKDMVAGGFYFTGTLPNDAGLLVALGGEPTSLYVGREVAAEFVQKDGAKYIFRVVERVQFVARDPRAFVRLKFK